MMLFSMNVEEVAEVSSILVVSEFPEVFPDEFVKPPSMDECCPMSSLGALTIVRVAGRCALSNP